jgi:hypothetical protein
MPAKGTTYAGQLLALIFQGTTIPGLADNTATAPLTELWVALHTADPGAGGNQSTSEAAYTGYARQAVPRTSLGFTVTGDAVTLVANVVFPVATAGSETETFFSIGTASTGAGQLLYFGPVAQNVAVAPNIQPVLVAPYTEVTET